jgi:hypothetical protein
MKTYPLGIIAAAIALTLTASVQAQSVIRVATASAQQEQRPLANDDVVKMVKGGLPESTIVSAIRANPTNFDISVDALISLRQAGVTQPEMDAMIAAESNKRSTGSRGSAEGSGPTTAALRSDLHVELLSSGPAQGSAASQGTLPLTSEKTQLTQTPTKAKSLAGLAGDTALNQGMMSGVSVATMEAVTHSSSMVGGIGAGIAGGTVGSLMVSMMSHRNSTLTYVWAVPGANSANLDVPARGANFAVSFAGVAGVNPNDYEPAIVKLTSTSNNWRLVGATQGKQDEKKSSTLDWQAYSDFVEDRIPTQSRKLAPGEYQISPTADLAPGEYGVVLRPLSKDQKFSGSDVAGNLGSGLIFNSIWSFEIR